MKLRDANEVNRPRQKDLGARSERDQTQRALAPDNGKIQFRCPNGHAINAPTTMAGQTVKCPKCFATFRVPDGQNGKTQRVRPKAEKETGQREKERRKTVDNSAGNMTKSNGKKGQAKRGQAVTAKTVTLPAVVAPSTTEPNKDPPRRWFSLRGWRERIRQAAAQERAAQAASGQGATVPNAKRHPWNLDTPVFTVGGIPYDWRMLYTGGLVIGATGSGKSTGVRDLYLRACFRLGAGAFCPCVKVTDAAEIRQIAIECGREADIVWVDEDSGEEFDFLYWELERLGNRSGFTTNVVDLLVSLTKVNQKQRGEGNDPIWDELLKLLLTSAIDACVIGQGSCSLEDIKKMIISAPKEAADVHDLDHQATSFCQQMLQRGFEKKKDAVEAADHADVCRFFLDQWPTTNSRTRSSAEAHWYPVANAFRGRIRGMFCGGRCTWRPEDTWESGKIVILAVPIDTKAEVGKIAQRLAKRCFQRGLQARIPHENMRPVLFLADEYQHLAEFENADELFLSNSRSKACVPLFLTQSYDALLSAAGGGPKAKHMVDALAAGLQTKWMLRCSHTTASWCSEVVSDHYVYMGHASGSAGGAILGQAHGGGSQQRQPVLLPNAWHTLRTGGPPDWIVEAYVFAGGEHFPNGLPVAKVAIRQQQTGVST